MSKTLMAVLLTLYAIFLAPLPGTQAFTYSEAWLPSDDDALLFNATSGFELYLFDWEEGHVRDTAADLRVIDTLGESDMLAILDFYVLGGTYFAKNRFAGQAVDLGDSFEFGLYFFDGSEFYSAYAVDGVKDLYTLAAGPASQHQVSLFDADPVPVPGAIWLLGPGILGLLGLRGRRPESPSSL